MRSMRTSILLLAASCFVLMGFGQQAAAQCGPVAQLDGIALLAGNPFQAERVRAFTPEAEGKIVPLHWPATLIARDGQGRVRAETTGGKFKVDEGEGTGTEAVQHIITICDPVSQKMTRLDTLNKTATVQALPTGSPLMRKQAQGAFCSVYTKLSVSMGQKEDLGHQTIEGFDAEGVRTTRPMPTIRNGEATTSQNVTDLWCTDELGALLLQVNQTGMTERKLELKLTKITRGEPDATLFQIPPDYRIVERVPEKRRIGLQGTLGSGPATLPTVPPNDHPQ
jgi:hypothetical protein